jgi:hypothetical protein
MLIDRCPCFSPGRGVRAGGGVADQRASWAEGDVYRAEPLLDKTDHVSIHRLPSRSGHSSSLSRRYVRYQVSTLR